MAFSITLQNNMLTVTSATKDKDGWWANGTATCTVPEWSSRAALLTLLDAAMIEAEMQMQKNKEKA